MWYLPSQNIHTFGCLFVSKQVLLFTGPYFLLRIKTHSFLLEATKCAQSPKETL